MIAILINVATFLLAVYLSIHGKSRPLRVSVWMIAGMLTLGNVYVQYKEIRKEVLYFDILTPNMTSKEAYDYLSSSFSEELKKYELIDLIGSYYICFKKPETFFHRFPEWVFVFRSKDAQRFLEFRVSDTRIPPIPLFRSLNFKALLNPTFDPRLSGGEIVSFMTLKVTPEYLGIYLPHSEDYKPDPSTGSYILAIIDQDCRSLIELTGGTSNDLIAEVVESVNDKVFARVRVAGRPTDYEGNRTIIQDPTKLGKISIIRSEFDSNSFYRTLKPITIYKWKVDIDEAIMNAIKKGAKAIPPDKLGMEGGPGSFRLLNTSTLNLNGAFWRMPYRIGIRPLLVDADDGKVYAIDNSGKYATSWGKNFILKE